MKSAFRLTACILCLAARCLIPDGLAAPLPGTFQQIDGDAGGWFTGFAIHASGRIYGRTDVGGVYRSDDLANSWQFLSGDMNTMAALNVQGVAVAASDSNVVYQAVGVSYAPTDPNRGIWKSTDGGATWVHVKDGINFSGNDEPRWGGECLVIRPGNDNEVWAGSRGGGLWRTINAGASWQRIDGSTFSGITLTTILFDSELPGFVWVGGEGGIWLSRDNGATWTRAKEMSKVWRIVRKTRGALFASGRDGGAPALYRITAGDWNNPLTYSYLDRWSKWLDAFQAARGYRTPDENPLLTVLSDGRLVAGAIYTDNAISTNDGDSWTLLGMGITGTQPRWQYSPLPSRVWGGRNQIVQDPNNASRWFLAAGFGPMRSDDAGKTWRYMLTGVEEHVAWKVRFHPTDPSRVFIPLADMGAGVITDGGASGIASRFILPKFPFPDDNILYARTVLANAGSRLIAPGGEQITHEPRIYLSSNNGLSWTKAKATGLPIEANKVIVDSVVSRDNPDDFLVFTGGPISSGSGGLYRSVDAGATFAKCSGLPLGYAVGDEFYWDVDLDADATDNNVRYLLIRTKGFYKSTDRGNTWTRPTVQPRRNFGRIAADAVIGGRLWAGFTTGETSFGLDTSTDGGTSWKAVPGFDEVLDIDAVNGRLAVLGRRSGDAHYKIYYSGDNGATWGEITRPGYRFGNAHAVAVDPWRIGTVWISTNGRGVSSFTPAVGIEAWRVQHFGANSATAAAADTADPDGDGRPNRLEYALGSDPLAADTSPAVAGAVVTDGTGQHLRLTASRTGRPADVALVVEGSSDLVNWSEGGMTILTDTDTLLVIQDSQTVGSPGQRFLRLKVGTP